MTTRNSNVEAHAASIAKGYDLIVFSSKFGTTAQPYGSYAGPYIPKPVPQPDGSLVSICADMDPAFVKANIPAMKGALNARIADMQAAVTDLNTLDGLI